MLPASYISRTNKLAQLFALIFRRSSCQQPLLAGALGGAAWALACVSRHGSSSHC